MNILNNLFNFRNKIILITGCNGQVGTSLVNLYISLGSKVYGLDFIGKKKINDKNFHYIYCDIRKEKNLKRTLQKIFKIEKKIDVIINSAATAIFNNYVKRTEKEIENVFKTNVSSIIYIIKNYSILFKKFKMKKGNILNIGSIYGFLSPDFNIYSKGDRFSSEIYGASKGSVIQLTKYFAVLLAKNKINVNCISPGGIINKKVQTKKFISKYKKRVPKFRMANTTDLFTATLYLTSNKSDYTTGQNIVIDGGLSIK